MGSDVQKVGSLVERLLHHPVLLDVEAHDGLLKVPHPTVDKLCGSGQRERTKTFCIAGIWYKQGLLYHRTCKPDFLCSWPSLNSYLK